MTFKKILTSGISAFVLVKSGPDGVTADVSFDREPSAQDQSEAYASIKAVMEADGMELILM
jgi:hypothetical protein